MDISISIYFFVFCPSHCSLEKDEVTVKPDVNPNQPQSIQVQIQVLTQF